MARAGCWYKSIISRVYFPSSSFSQISLIFLTARNDRSEEPAIYSRKRWTALRLAACSIVLEAFVFGAALRGIMDSTLDFLGQFQPDKGLPPIAKIADDFSDGVR